MNSKKSQITLYIIIGLLIVVFIGLLIYVMRMEKPEVPSVVQNLPSDVVVVQNYVEQCIRVTAEEGLNLLGKNGGYIEPANLMIETSPMAYNSDALLYEPDTLPYWNFVDQYNRLRSLKPRLYMEVSGDGSIEDQLANYVEANLKNCTKDFSVFSDSFTIYTSTVTAAAKVRDKDLLVSVIYPLRIVAKGNESSTEMKDFTSIVPVNLKQIYEFADSITAAEQKYHFLESMTMNMISVYSGINEKALPPTSSLKLGREKIVWSRTEVEELLTNDLLDFVRLIQIKNALNYNPLMLNPSEPDYKLKQGLYNSFNYELPGSKAYNITSEFFYPQEPIYLTIDDEEIIMPKDRIPQNIVTDMLGLQIQDYGFEYDIAYPVIVKLRDPIAFNYRGYEFQFALEANIRDNTPVNASMLPQGEIPTSKININKPGQLVTDELKVNAFDKSSNAALPGVQVYYKCGQKVYIGITGQDGSISANFPYCLAGGKIIYSKQGYMGSAINFNNHENSPRQFSIYLYPKVKFDVTIRKRTLDNINALANSGPLDPLQRKIMELEQATPISIQEKVVMVVQRIKQESEEEAIPMPNFIVFNPNIPEGASSLIKQLEEQYYLGQISLEQKNNAIQMLAQKGSSEKAPETYSLELVPGNYTVEAYLINYAGANIPEKVDKTGIWPFQKDVTYPSQNFSIWQSGGASFNTTLYDSEVYRGGNQAIFYVFDLGVPKTWDELANYKKIEDFSQYNYLLKPIIQASR